MTKYFCDSCGKEVKRTANDDGTRNAYEIDFKFRSCVYLSQLKLLCPDCVGKIFGEDYIKTKTEEHEKHLAERRALLENRVKKQEDTDAAD